MTFLRAGKLRWLVLIIILLCGSGIYLYRKYALRPDFEMPQLLSASSQASSMAMELCRSSSNDFENGSGDGYVQLNSDGAKSVNRVYEFSDKIEFGPTFADKFKSFCDPGPLKKVTIACRTFSKSDPVHAVLVLSVEKDGNSLFWTSASLHTEKGRWVTTDTSCFIPAEAAIPEAELKVYVWNKDKESFQIDDFKVDYFSKAVSNFPYGSYPERYVVLGFDTISDHQVPGYSNEKHLFGTGSYELNSDRIFSPAVTRRVGTVADGELKFIIATVNLNPENDQPDLYLAISLKDSKGREYFFKNNKKADRTYTTGEWSTLRARIELPVDLMTPDDIVSVYAWNKGGTKVYVDNLTVQFGESNIRSGSKPLLDLPSLGENGYGFTRNTPPFRVKRLPLILGSAAAPLHFYDNGRLIEPDPSAFDLTCCGTFMKGEHGRQQLFLFYQGRGMIFEFCDSGNAFRKVGELTADALPSAVINAGHVFVTDLNGDGMDEVILSDGVSFETYIIEPAIRLASSGCNVVATSIDAKSVKKITNPSISQGKKMKLLTCGFFTNSEKSQMLFSNAATGTFAVMDGNGKLMLTGEHELFKSLSPDETVIRSVPMTSSKAGSILAFRKGSTGNFKYFKILKSPPYLENHVYSGSEIRSFSGAEEIFTLPGNTQKLIYRSYPRFGMYLTNMDESNGFSVLNEIEFSGYTGVTNPKFYEFRRCLVGSFIASGKSQILIFGACCEDPDFSGNSCKKWTAKGDFPPIIQLYNLD